MTAYLATQKTFKNSRVISFAESQLKWQVGSFGYDSWCDWLLCEPGTGMTRLRTSQHYRNKQPDYASLTLFWRIVAQLAVVKPYEFRVVIAAVLAFCGSRYWVYVLYGKLVYLRYINSSQPVGERHETV